MLFKSSFLASLVILSGSSFGKWVPTDDSYVLISGNTVLGYSGNDYKGYLTFNTTKPVASFTGDDNIDGGFILEKDSDSSQDLWKISIQHKKKSDPAFKIKDNFFIYDKPDYNIVKCLRLVGDDICTKLMVKKGKLDDRTCQPVDGVHVQHIYGNLL